MASEKKKMENGYVSFDKNDIHTEDSRNTIAEAYFLQMLDVPKRAVKKINKGKENELTDEDFYPCTKEEVEKMDELLQKAEAAIDDRSDNEFLGQIAEMKGVIAWSKKRHWEFAWWIVICVFIMGGYYWREAGKEAKERDGIEAWTEAVSTEKWKVAVAEYDNRAANNKGNPEAVAYWEKKSAELSALSPKEYQQQKIESQNGEVWKERGKALWCFAWILLYVIAVRPYGYMITKRRKETAVYGGLRRFLFGIAGAMFGAAGALQFTEVITKWSDGTTTRGDDGTGPLILVMKLGLVVGAILLVIWVARYVIVIATVMGFIRNYDLLGMAKRTLEAGKIKNNEEVKA